MKVYREKRKNKKDKRFFRQGNAQRYVDLFSRAYSLPDTSGNGHQFFTPVLLIIAFSLLFTLTYPYTSSFVNFKYLSVVMSNFSETLKRIPAPKISITFPELPNVSIRNFPVIKVPSVKVPSLPPLPALSSPKFIIGKFVMSSVSSLGKVLGRTFLFSRSIVLSLFQSIARVSPVVFRNMTTGGSTLYRFINPFSFFTAVWDLTFHIIQTVFLQGLVAFRYGMQILVVLLPRLNPIPLIQTLGTVIFRTITFIIGITGKGIQFLFTIVLSLVRMMGNGIVFSIRFVTQLLLTLSLSIYQGTVRVASALFQFTRLSAQFVLNSTIAIFKFTLNIVVSTLRLLDPRPLLFRIGHAIAQWFRGIENFIYRYAKALWDIASPPFVGLWNVSKVSVIKAAKDLRFEEVPQAKANEETTQYSYTTN